MKVELLYFEGCPNHAPTVERVREALQSENETADVQEIEVQTQGEAEALGFLGSPSVRINGLDIEPQARSLKSYGLSCRTYLHGPTRSGVPSIELIRLALKEQGATHESCCQANPAGFATPSSVGGARGTGSRRAALFAGGIAAVLASACCLGPLLLVTVGVSGAWIGNLTRLEPYRPIFIVIAIAALFFAWRSIYRPVPACKPGEVCAVPQTRRLYKVMFWASVALTLLAGISIFRQILLLIRRLRRDFMNKMIRRLTSLVFIAAMSIPGWAATKTVTLNVPGMTCPTCPITIKKALNKVQGVSKVDVNYEKKQAVVTFDDAETDTKRLVKATTDAGYPSTPEATAK